MPRSAPYIRDKKHCMVAAGLPFPPFLATSPAANGRGGVYFPSLLHSNRKLYQHSPNAYTDIARMVPFVCEREVSAALGGRTRLLVYF